MHITEGIIVGKAAALYTAAGASLVAWGVSRMKVFVKKAPENRPLLGMGTALVFFVSLLPIPAFTGTCSHPCGTPLIGILLGPVIGIALTGISLLLQAAFFAHGGFSTWGANVVALGFCGCGFGWGTFRLARRLGLPLWAAGGAGGLVGDLMVYAASGLILGTSLVQAPEPQFSLSGYLVAIYAAYLPTQLPIAVGEMLVTGLALHYASRQRPEVLEALGILGTRKIRHPPALLAIMALTMVAATLGSSAKVAAQANPAGAPSESAPAGKPAAFSGMDEAVNERLAEAAGRPAREPFINTEAMGDLWNLLLLSAGGICGFVFGRYWHLLWGRRR
jgi:cobalt/nickel transport system permease protein